MPLEERITKLEEEVNILRSTINFLEDMYRELTYKVEQ